MSKGQEVSVSLTATVAENPLSISLQLSPAGSYKIWRKLPTSSDWVAPIAQGIVSTFQTWDIQLGQRYEFKVESSDGVRVGYILAGIKIPAVADRGKLVLVVEGTFANELAPKIDRFIQDLTGEGYSVARVNVSKSDTPPSVKSKIKTIWSTDQANTKTVVLLGAVPVPYSGNFAYDHHGNHIGAQPADCYYGEMSGSWTDASVNSTSAESPRNRNVPGDGKFDQSTIPDSVKLIVGRIDLSNLICFSNKPNSRSEKDLLAAYLDKDHAWRTGQVIVKRRAVVTDNFSDRGFSAVAWRMDPTIVGADIIEVPSDLIGHLASNDYLLSYACGGGGYASCVGLGHTQWASDDFATTEVKCPFFFLLGSYFGDWDNESNLLRAALGSGQCLTSCLSGNPNFIGHRMALGGTIGDSLILTQNNSSEFYAGESARGVHVALMGDPTLTINPVRPITGLKGEPIPNGFRMTWDLHPDESRGLHGYRVYRSRDGGPFVDLNPNRQISDRGFSDGNYPGNVYMIRAEKLILTPSGSYYQLSPGVFITNGATPPPAPTTRKLEILSSLTPTGPWTYRGTVTVDSSGSTEFYKLGIL